MRYLTLAVLVVCACAQSRDLARETISVHRPTVIGFVEDATHEDFEQLNDRAIIQDDFVTSWGGFAQWAHDAGIDARTEAPGFEVLTSRGARHVPRDGAGYVLVDGEGRIQILTGVRTDSDLRTAACDFFGSLLAKAAGCSRG